MTPWTVPAKLLCPWDFPGKNTGVGCHSLLQGNLPYPGLKPASPALADGFFTTDSLGKVTECLVGVERYIPMYKCQNGVGSFSLTKSQYLRNCKMILSFWSYLTIKGLLSLSKMSQHFIFFTCEKEGVVIEDPGLVFSLLREFFEF